MQQARWPNGPGNPLCIRLVRDDTGEWSVSCGLLTLQSGQCSVVYRVVSVLWSADPAEWSVSSGLQSGQCPVVCRVVSVLWSAEWSVSCGLQSGQCPVVCRVQFKSSQGYLRETSCSIWASTQQGGGPCLLSRHPVPRPGSCSSAQHGALAGRLVKADGRLVKADDQLVKAEG
ncbi:hypothetical protein ACOMHN_015764 [Nucella lapillus]